MHATRASVSEHWAPARPSRAAHISPRTSTSPVIVAAEPSRFTELPAEREDKEATLTPPAEWAPPRASTPIIDTSADDGSVAEDLPEPIQPSPSPMRADAKEWTASAAPSSAEITAIAEQFWREKESAPVSNGVQSVDSSTSTVESTDAVETEANGVAHDGAASQDGTEPGEVIEAEPERTAESVQEPVQVIEPVETPSDEPVVEVEPTPVDEPTPVLEPTTPVAPSPIVEQIAEGVSVQTADTTPSNEPISPMDEPITPPVEMKLSDLDFAMLGSASFGGPAEPPRAPVVRSAPSDELVAFDDDDAPAVVKPVDRSNLFQKALGGVGGPSPAPRTVTFAETVKPSPPPPAPVVAAPRTISSSTRARRPVLAEADDEAQF